MELDAFKLQGALLEETESAVTAEWGVDWDEAMIARDLLQNFFDARSDAGEPYQVTLRSSRLLEISGDEEFDLKRLYFLASDKDRTKIGQYGEGFKAAAVCLLRAGVGVCAASARNAVVISLRTDDKARRPLVYRFYRLKQACAGNRLWLHGPSAKQVDAVKNCIGQFFHPANKLIGLELTEVDGLSVHLARGSVGAIFYRRLRRATIDNLPIILAAHDPEPTIEKLIGSDRDRKEFGAKIASRFFSLFGRRVFPFREGAVRKLLQIAKPLWSNAKGHPLIEAISCRHYECADIFGPSYFADSRYRFDAKLQQIEQQWQSEGRIKLPEYFTSFGLVSARQFAEAESEKSRKEALSSARAPSSLEHQMIDALNICARDIVPEMIVATDAHECFVVESQQILGMIRLQRSGYYLGNENRIFLNREMLTEDFPTALATLLHEYSHINGNERSSEFARALTRCVEQIIRHPKVVEDARRRWNRLRSRYRAK